MDVVGSSERSERSKKVLPMEVADGVTLCRWSRSGSIGNSSIEDITLKNFWRRPLIGTPVALCPW